MGELVKTDVVNNWLTTVDSARTGLIEAAKQGNKIATAFAMAEARATLIESLDDKQIRARLLRITDDKIGMVELANNPSEDDRVRICAMAILSGFCPGDDQFAVFGGRGGGKLYIKENGYRTLFAQFGIIPNVHADHPEYVPFGKQGKKCWRVSGYAGCEYNGSQIKASFEIGENGIDFRLGINGNDSDNIAGVAAKARRQMLKMLWSMVNPLMARDHADEEDLVVDEPQRLENKPATEQAEVPIRQQQALAFDQSFQGAQRRIKDPDQLAAFNRYWEDIKNAKSKDDLRTLYSDVGGEVKALGKNNVDELQRYSKWVAEGMAE